MVEDLDRLPPETETCVHRWLLEPQNGPTSAGTCKKCGLTRSDFVNALDDGVSLNMDREKLTPESHDLEISPF